MDTKGGGKIRLVRLQTLESDFGNLRMKKNENVQDSFTRSKLLSSILTLTEKNILSTK